MEFGILKCAAVSLQRAKKTRWEGIQLSNGEEIDAPELDRWIRKQLTAGRALHPKANVMGIYIKHWYGGRGLISVEECCTAELRSVDFNLANSEEELLKIVARLEKLRKDKIESGEDYSNRIEQDKMAN